MKRKVDENKKSKETKLLQSALTLFTQKDIQNVTVQEIVNMAGVAKGTFYLYFHDKYEIRDVLIYKETATLLQQAYQELEQNDIRNFEDSVIFLINQVLINLENNPTILKFIERNLSWGIFQDHLSHVIDNEEINLLQDFTDRAHTNGYHYERPEIVLYLILEMTGSTCYNAILEKKPIDIQSLKPYLFNAIRAILSQGTTIESL